MICEGTVQRPSGQKTGAQNSNSTNAHKRGRIKRGGLGVGELKMGANRGGGSVTKRKRCRTRKMEYVTDTGKKGALKDEDYGPEKKSRQGG